MSGTPRTQRARAAAAAPPPSRAARRSKPPVEYSMLYTATLCLLAYGAVMVYSASSAESLLDGSGDPAYYLKRYLAFGAIGLMVMWVLSRRGLGVVRALTPVLLAGSLALTVAVMLPGVGVTVNGATRWIAAGPIQFQPSELLKVAVVLYAVGLLARRPEAVKTIEGICKPLLLVVGGVAALLLLQPDLGTAMVISFAVGALLVAAGTQLRHLAAIGGAAAFLTLVMILVEPYRRERLMSFLDPWADAGDSGFQIVQSMIAIGSGGFFGVGLGESVQKIFYLPEAHTDMILAIVGEELGILGITGVVALYGIVAFAGLRAAKAATDRYSKLLAAGITSLILSQASLNLLGVMGIAPLTGVPLPFMSYGNSNLIVLLGAMGLLLNVASGKRRPAAARRPSLDVVEGGGARDARRDRGGRNGRARGAGAGRRRRAAG